MSIEKVHENPVFGLKKSEYFQNFILRDLPAVRVWKANGLINEGGSDGWRNVARHQLLSGAVTETIMELIGATEDDTKKLVHLSLVHDGDKRRRQEGRPEIDIIREEIGKNDFPIAATGSNFAGFSNWELDARVMRYVDSSIGEEGLANTYGARDPKNLPKVILVPWRQRLQGFKDNKVEEGELGREIYGMTTWEKLEEIMGIIEKDLYDHIIERQPELAASHPQPSDLTNLIEARLHEKILES